MKEIKVNKNVLFVSIVVVAVIVVAVSLMAVPASGTAVVFETSFGDVSVSVEVASTQQEILTGLMHRESLQGGMLFVFGEEAFHSFWMKNTLIPLDMIFISEDLRVVDIKNAVPCLEDPCPVYGPRQRALYVVEVNAGFALDQGIGIGTGVRIEGL